MSTSRTAWQRREKLAASLFGAKRQRCSGSSGRDDETTSDSTHPRLYIETKLRAASAVHSLWDETDARARKEGKAPVLVLACKGRHGMLVVCHERHLDRMLAERLRVFLQQNDLKPLMPFLEAADIADLLQSSEVLCDGDS